MNESPRQHREGPFSHPRRNFPTGERLKKLQNRKTTGMPGGNAHDRRKFLRAQS
jgi:hypothetical protein